MNGDPTEAEKQRAERGLGIRSFDEAELAARTARVQALLAEHDLDALLVCDETNVVYLSGLDTPSFTTRARPIFVLVPASGEPAFVCSTSQATNARAAVWIDDIRSFTGFEPEAIDVVAELLRDRSLSNARIGCELGRETRLGMTAAGFDLLRSQIASATFCDGSAVIWAARLRKSPAEIDRLRTAGAINGAAFEAALGHVRAGVSERDVRQAWATALVQAGADRPGYLAVHSGPGSYRRVSSSATDRILEPGDLLWMDGGPVYRGYWSDITRMISIGEPTADQRRHYRFAWDVVHDLVASVRPGVTAGDIARAGARIFDEAGLPMGSAARIGHGVGAELTEPPSVVDGDETELAPGMVLAIETGVARWDGYFVIEDNLVVTAGGAELLAPARTGPAAREHCRAHRGGHMSVHAVNHIGFAVSNLERSVAFYSELLGEPPYFDEVYDVEYIGRIVGYEGAIQHAAFFRLPGQPELFLELIQYLHPPAGAVDMETYNAGNAHLCLACDDLDAEYERLRSIGAVFRSDGPVSSDYGVYEGARSLYFRDPDGISVQLVEIPAGVDPAGRR